MNSPTPPRVSLGDLIRIIAHAVDLVGEDDYYHGRRVGLIAAQLARQLGFNREGICHINQAGLLHDCGVSSTTVHRKLLNAMEWEGADEHCQAGFDLLKDYPPLASFAPLVRHHHTRWSQHQQGQICPADALLANLIFLADRIDVLCAPFYGELSLLTHTKSIRDVINFHRDEFFAPQLLDAFLDASVTEAFWLPLMSAEAIQSHQAMLRLEETEHLLSWKELRAGAEILGKIVDAKTPYTHRHSQKVAKIAGLLARKIGLSPLHCEMIEVAGHLHDIGKLHVPDDMLESRQPLNPQEAHQIHTHSAMTFRVLHEIGELGGITRWAAYHHERPDGLGYPFHLRGDEIPLEARIICVADVYQGLTQDRPDRPGKAAGQIRPLLDDMARDGMLDRQIVALANASQDEIELLLHEG